VAASVGARSRLISIGPNQTEGGREKKHQKKKEPSIPTCHAVTNIENNNIIKRGSQSTQKRWEIKNAEKQAAAKNLTPKCTLFNICQKIPFGANTKPRNAKETMQYYSAKNPRLLGKRDKTDTSYKKKGKKAEKCAGPPPGTMTGGK